MRYRTLLERKSTMKARLGRLGRNRRAVKVIEAIRDLSFVVPGGSLLAVIGANGAGKSTLLRGIAGIVPPAAGRIAVNGRVTALLSLGVGFNADLSGGENIVLGGLFAGMTPEQVEGHYDEVVEFSGLGEFIDMPLKAYSSGMKGRLAFAVSTTLRPDILLIDEALAAGDAAFAEKAAAKMRDLMETASAIVLVTHSMPVALDLADTCLWLHRGEAMGIGEPQRVVAEYVRFSKAGKAALGGPGS